jgi:hypothetical protein
MLLDSRSMVENTVKVEATIERPAGEKKLVPEKEDLFSPSAPLSSISAPPPIATVLHDIYQDETGASN